MCRETAGICSSEVISQQYLAGAKACRQAEGSAHAAAAKKAKLVRAYSACSANTTQKAKAQRVARQGN